MPEPFNGPPMRVMALRSEGVGYRMPGPRDLAHEDPQWFEMDLDDPFVDPDTEPFDPLPTERHRTIPD